MANLQIVEYSPKSFVVIGDTKEVKDSLKTLGGKFNARLSCGAGWIFSAKQRESVEKFISDGTLARTERTAERTNDKEFLEEYLNEMKKVWHDSKKMMDFEKERFSSAVRLSNGGLMVFEKPRIETSFCFGYSLSQYDSKDFDRANEMAHKARTDENYFLKENLASFDREINELTNLKGDCGFDDLHPMICRKAYNSQDSILNVFEYCCSRYDFSLFTKNDEQEDGMDVYTCDYQMFGRYYDLQPMSEDDRKTILAALNHEREKFEKRLRAYLKRYGTSKLHTWSYWRDE